MANASFVWNDPFLLDQQLTEDERMVREAAAVYSQERLATRIQDAFRNETTDPAIFREMGELGLLGPTIDQPVALAYLDTALAHPGTPVNAMVRGKAVPMVVSPLPFVPNRYYRG